MDAVKFLKAIRRMCNSTECEKCAINGMCEYVFVAAKDGKIEEVVRGVQEWANDNPLKTREQDFFEKFPNATRTCENIPIVCAGECGYCGKPSEFGRFEDCDKYDEDCDKCWLQEMEE